MVNLIRIAKKEGGFTLVELIIVIAILTLIIGLGVTGFISLKKVQQLEQAGADLYSVVRDQQRQSMLFERQLDENWIWGTVISFEDIQSGGNKVMLYKYCAPSTTIEFNAYPTDSDNLPIANKDSNKKCIRTTAGLTRMSEKALSIPLSEFSAKLVGSNDVTYVVFETVSGKIHYYGSNGSSLALNRDFEIVLGADLPAKRVIRFDSETARIELEKVDGDYVTK